MELGATHRLAYGDAPEVPPCHGIPGHPTVDRQKVGRVGDGKLRDAGGGHVEVPTQYLTAVCREETAEHRAKTFHGLVLCGKLRTATRWITEREKGGVLLPEEHCTKTGEHVLEVIRTKHPDSRPPSAACLDTYPDKPPEMVPVDITDNLVSAVAGRL